jgi:hypothetical protein
LRDNPLTGEHRGTIGRAARQVIRPKWHRSENCHMRSFASQMCAWITARLLIVAPRIGVAIIKSAHYSVGPPEPILKWIFAASARKLPLDIVFLEQTTKPAELNIDRRYPAFRYSASSFHAETQARFHCPPFHTASLRILARLRGARLRDRRSGGLTGWPGTMADRHQPSVAQPMLRERQAESARPSEPSAAASMRS